MKAILKTPVTAAVTAAMLSLSGGAWADGGGRHHDGYGYHGKQQRYQHYDRHDRHYQPYYRGYGHRGGHHDNDEGEALLIGLLMGGLVGYAIGDTHQQAQAQRYEPYPPPSAPPVASYPPQVVYPAPQAAYENHGTCLQEREYQTKVIIGGREVDAYGTACLQPDGSWRRGPVQVDSY